MSAKGTVESGVGSHVDMNVLSPLSKSCMSKTESKNIYPQLVSIGFSGGKEDCKF